jgi:hypothetical protein
VMMTSGQSCSLKNVIKEELNHCLGCEEMANMYEVGILTL